MKNPIKPSRLRTRYSPNSMGNGAAWSALWSARGFCRISPPVRWAIAKRRPVR
jgi:hypothetical protein